MYLIGVNLYCTFHFIVTTYSVAFRPSLTANLFRPPVLAYFTGQSRFPLLEPEISIKKLECFVAIWRHMYLSVRQFT